MTNAAKIAVAGAGKIGRKHIAMLANSTSAQLAAIVDPDPGAAILAQAMGVPHVTALTDLSVLPGDIDGVVLATPTGLHADQAVTAIKMGLPVLIEKPLAATAAQAEDIVTAATAAGVPVLVGHHRRYNPIITTVRQALQAGLIGQVVTVQTSVLLCKPAEYFDPEWRRQPGAGPILTNLVHEIDTLRFLLGEVAGVQAVASNRLRGFAVEDTAAVILRFVSGAVATLAVSDTAAARWSWELTAAENADYPATGQASTWIAGTEGALELPTLRHWAPAGPPSWTTPMRSAVLARASVDPLAAQIDHFVAVIRGQAAPLITAKDAAETLAVVDRILLAANTGNYEAVA